MKSKERMKDTETQREERKTLSGKTLGNVST